VSTGTIISPSTVSGSTLAKLSSLRKTAVLSSTPSAISGHTRRKRACMKEDTRRPEARRGSAERLITKPLRMKNRSTSRYMRCIVKGVPGRWNITTPTAAIPRRASSIGRRSRVLAIIVDSGMARL